MTVLSVLRTAARPARLAITQNSRQVAKMSDHRAMNIIPSRFQWNKFKDMLHLYFVGAAIPLLAGIGITNMMVGPATLSEIPEGYVPREDEYYKSPITRFLVRNFTRNEQMEYEKKMQYIWETEHKRQLRLIEKRVKKLMAERGDYKAWYYTPHIARKYQRIVRKETEELMERRPAA
ncbi:NADH dehydrogenase [ubiquinone] 1 beta subcomplex subunit 5, mitochondrial-like [Amphibalanus amphitrite]|uniref:NADH dehydrogenase [ubiquinone] 1 beta subcomplex subunit 5, mitochondrial-like n=1 Tax=Amphibalanus amphitrite TaxID=1232801 RepID=UPI001C91A994|nr:NADH dehydrogenase [ubiquinone] 1 beta subcomplex subunit 5, mitochondrial-like [Amphibalanus amphitrite]XP_043215413.1 NADH dehydrogenase [ubiquinone] 1 beta subcomplex subunit 5, mitochondrial-like [Amphibalanus amphitrite]XP_043215414.1 NADH dehydrogenase [ubiquinone] 1 beta subcomplex subunit 5, mitochondrial-like [Amphibalanus amphitrite]XP_043215416.1 NADH dehydrogenase [ubiquinone] 1 beta subcomplex subunit 5, mitochondrial-like [Amphibalanus amphitrite]